MLAEHGRHARIVSAERVVSGGIRGFFAKQHFEVVVELPESGSPSVHSMDLPTRVGLAALLEEADTVESALAEAAPDQPTTASPDFAALLRQMTRDMAPPPGQQAAPPQPPALGLLPIVSVVHAPSRAQLPAGAPAQLALAQAAPAAEPPLPLERPGDLVLCIGARSDAALVASAWATQNGAEIAACAPSMAGADVSAHPGLPQLGDRRDAAAARARGVQRGAACIAVLELAAARADADVDSRLLRERQLGTAAGLLADQLWLVVDVSRKDEDTAAWVAACREIVDVHGIVAIGGEETATPGSVAALGLPVLWHTKG
ncbi:hypothetical protein SAMN04489834_2414 [Microterricola viridarii]|uniref:Uncharacterized protein n=1 Tax=Microterricola viridarii TaxID=412690 RepID=A0A1H1W348_9MICO|nr:hypothetical protein SAMN04489834_2414 [Microterricola viridarii]